MFFFLKFKGDFFGISIEQWLCQVNYHNFFIFCSLIITSNSNYFFEHICDPWYMEKFFVSKPKKIIDEWREYIDCWA